jgi:hypothetical protein
MENSILKEFNKKDVEAYLRVLDYLQGFTFWKLFPWKPSATFSYETISGTRGIPVVGDIVAYNSSAPLKSRKVISKLKGDIPSIRVKRLMSEKDMNELITFRAMGTSEGHKAILRMIYDDVDFAILACLGRLEWITYQALSNLTISLTASNNGDGIVTEHAIDFGMPAANKRCIESSTATRKWGTGTADQIFPITDIQAVVKAGKALGLRFKKILMNDTQFAQFISASQVINLCAPYMGFGNLHTASFAPTPTLEAINAFLRSQSLPIIEVIDRQVIVEDGDFSQTTLDVWTDNYLTFVPGEQVGNMFHAPMAEETFGLNGRGVQVKKDNVLVTKYSDVDPLREFTKGEINAFPSWDTVDYCMRLNVAKNEADGLDD